MHVGRVENVASAARSKTSQLGSEGTMALPWWTRESPRIRRASPSEVVPVLGIPMHRIGGEEAAGADSAIGTGCVDVILHFSGP